MSLALRHSLSHLININLPWGLMASRFLGHNMKQFIALHDDRDLEFTEGKIYDLVIAVNTRRLSGVIGDNGTRWHIYERFVDRGLLKELEA